MKKKMTFTSLALVACLAAVSPARAQQTKDIVDTAVAAGSFKTLAKALTRPISSGRSKVPALSPGPGADVSSRSTPPRRSAATRCTSRLPVAT